jgi:hypothetical protein
MADAFAATVAPAPEQWYSFKPVWPTDPAEGKELARRAAMMMANEPLPGSVSPRPGR